VIRLVCDRCDRDMPVPERSDGGARWGDRTEHVVAFLFPFGWVAAAGNEHVCPRCAKREAREFDARVQAAFAAGKFT